MTESTGAPFIYIGALVRTGSTMLSEGLTLLPYSYIFHEPHLGRNILSWNRVDVRNWRENGVDLEKNALRIKLVALIFRMLGVRPDFVLRSVKRQILPGLSRQVIQLGVKETRNDGWRVYANHFPGMKILLLGRDPRDIYLSFHEQTLRFRPASETITPAKFAAQLLEQYSHQQEMLAAADCLPVRYEDLCTDPGVFEQVKKFARSPIPGRGAAGAFIGMMEEKALEHQRHGAQVTAVSVRRWQSEQDRAALVCAFEVFDRMQEYADYWGYRKG